VKPLVTHNGKRNVRACLILLKQTVMTRLLSNMWISIGRGYYIIPIGLLRWCYYGEDTRLSVRMLYHTILAQIVITVEAVRCGNFIQFSNFPVEPGAKW